MKFGKRDLWILECVRQAFFAARIRDVILASDAAKWITVHPNGKGMTNSGENAKGSPVLLDEETGEVLGGMGGKFTGMHISEACSTEPTENSQHVIRRGQEKRKNPEAFEAEQQRKMQEAEEAVAKAQEEAAAQAESEAENDKPVTVQELSANATPKDITKAFKSASSANHDLSTAEGRHEARMQKLDSLLTLRALDAKAVAAGAAAHIKSVGAPDQKSMQNADDVNAYLKQLLPNSSSSFMHADPEMAYGLTKGIYKVASAFPYISAALTGIGESVSQQKDAREFKAAELKRQNKTIQEYRDELSKAIKKEARDKEKQYLKENSAPGTPGYDEYKEYLEKGINHNYNPEKIKTLSPDDAFEYFRFITAGSKAQAKKIFDGLRERTGQHVTLDEQAKHELIMRHVKEECKGLAWRHEQDLIRRAQPYLDGPTPRQYGVPLGDIGMNAYGQMVREDFADIGAGSVTFNSQYTARKSEFYAAYYENIETGFHPPLRADVTPQEALAVHECIHAVDNTFRTKYGCFLSQTEEAKALFEKARADIVRTLAKEDYPYWATDPKEFAAEAMTAVFCAPPEAVRPEFREFHDLLKKAYKEHFGE